MQIILLIAGLILLLVNPPLFAAAATVGWVCLGVFALLTVLQVFWFFHVKSQMNNITRQDPFRNSRWP